MWVKFNEWKHELRETVCQNYGILKGLLGFYINKTAECDIIIYLELQK